MQGSVSRDVFKLLAPERLTAIVDIGSNPIDGAPPYAGMLSAGLCTVVGFEPQPAALAELNRRKGRNERYLPHAVGGGSECVLNVCAAGGMTSLLTPDPAALALFTDFSHFGEVVGEQQVQTKRLDDVNEIEHIDLLKIDIQGGEIEAIESGLGKLEKAVAIQTEVSFMALYHNQPSIGEVDTALRKIGFVPHCFMEIKTWPLASLRVSKARQLLEADLMYVRDFTEPQNLTGEQWKQLALIAHYYCNSTDLALHAINSAAILGGIGAEVGVKYQEILRQQSRRR